MRVAVLLLFIFSFIACNNSTKIPENFDYGKTENGLYENDYFGFDVPIPKDWHLQNKEQMQQIQEEGRKIVGEHNKDLAEKIKASEVTSAMLLSVFKYPEDSVVGSYNPSFGIMVENLGKFSGVHKGLDYLKKVKELMQQSGISYHFPSELSTEKLGNREFAKMETVATYGSSLEVRQSYYATIEKGFAISLIASFGDDEQKQKLEEILGNIRFR